MNFQYKAEHDPQMQALTDAKLSVLIADDHLLLAEVLAMHLSGQDGFATEIADTLQLAVDMVTKRGGYDVVLLDLHMPGMNGLEGLGKVIEANVGRPVALLSGNLRPETVEDAMRRGAASCIPKTLSSRSLVNAVRFIASGETFLPTPLLRREGEQVLRSGQLTPKERMVLKELCTGQSNKEIGRLLSLSEVTIKMHIRSICTKLGAKNRTQAAIFATEKRLL